MTEIAILPSHPINAFKSADLSEAMKDALQEEFDADGIIAGLKESEVLVIDVAALWKNWDSVALVFNDVQKSELLRVLRDLFSQPRKGGRMKPELIDLCTKIALSISAAPEREKELLIIFTEMLEIYDNVGVRGRIQEALAASGSEVKLRF